jgi:hypothetical protein
MSPTQLRDALLAADPLNRDWVARVNAAEAEFWRRCGAGWMIFFVCLCGEKGMQAGGGGGNETHTYTAPQPPRRNQNLGNIK